MRVRLHAKLKNINAGDKKAERRIRTIKTTENSELLSLKAIKASKRSNNKQTCLLAELYSSCSGPLNICYLTSFTTLSVASIVSFGALNFVNKEISYQKIPQVKFVLERCGYYPLQCPLWSYHRYSIAVYAFQH